ncbi:sulfite oxidase [Neobacillus bataviensis LMG 21833]|uniref:Sulfite oxidase n=1 Tax=Neobacillus bataviensis LMG 21833 TaxID=1117379 RepID=K6BUZ0_9BACI|nr:sulfite oxidase [Neobacillus bataviensis LMG 21833]
MNHHDRGLKTKAHLIAKSLLPENQETPIHFLEEKITPRSLTFRRNHFPYPKFPIQPFFLTITGSVKNPLIFHYSQITSMPSQTITALLECSGNKRAHFEPKVFGDQWKEGALSQGNWKGVPLSYLLSLTEVNTGAREIVFLGDDSGVKDGQHVHFQRSLPLEKALDQHVIVAWEHNQKPLSPKHGFPFRLIVPGWYGMASVKWLKTIHVINHSFSGPFQTDDYVYYPHKSEDKDSFPVTTNRVNSIIQHPLDRQILKPGKHEITGLAWTGEGVITSVEISVDNGVTWKAASLHNPTQKYQWVKWSISHVFEKNHESTVKVRAFDSTGQSQPDQAFWNRKGYGHNQVSQIKVQIEN